MAMVMGRRTRGRWATALTGLVLMAAGCGGDPAPTPTEEPAPGEPRIAFCVDEATQQANGVTLTRPDGETVQALVEGDGDAAIVFANQSDDNLCPWLPHASEFVARGYQTLLFRYSNQADYDMDVTAAIDAVRERGATTVFLVGASKGGTAVLAAAATADPPVDAVVSLSAPTDFGGVSATEHMAGFTTPVLFMAGTTDGQFADAARELHAACTATDKRLETPATNQHGISMLEPERFDLVADFLDEHRPQS